eukprot:TRINITY_DN12082_c0_g2_i5.p1 TRINITY_DN12082_c0_g2~~TRINITY_DN12082_c0_g2_i5.p1  ORF type:complete len:357 (+),score=44.07 TRINITY_DN12082_c0_g2_i5:200-1270(+)
MESAAISMKLSQLRGFLMSSWIDKFRKITFKTQVVQLPENFVRYLHEDGILIHPEYEKQTPDLDKLHEEQPKLDVSLVKIPEENNSSNDDEDANPPVFKDLDKKICEIIEDYGSEVFIKLNWKCPRDAVEWVPQLKCQSFGDIILLLKSSAIATDVLEKKHLQVCQDYEESNPDTDKLELVLRRWYAIQHSGEFRCFIKDSGLIAITQRKCAAYFPFLAEMEQAIKEMILNFFEQSVKDHLFEPTCIMDVYVEKKTSNGTYKVWLVDFNPWVAFTETLLFDWKELNEIETTNRDKFKNVANIQFRYVKDHGSIMYEDFQDFKTPLEFLEGPEKYQNVNTFMEMLKKKGNGEELYQQ